MTAPLDQPPPATGGSASATGPAGQTAADDGGAGDGRLRADPDRPADSGWREPPWFPARDRHRADRPSLFSIVVGLGLIVVGAYYFLDRTLGIAMPPIQWGSLWPIVLIVLGGVILVRSLQRKP
jgi:hypothetical protein